MYYMILYYFCMHFCVSMAISSFCSAISFSLTQCLCFFKDSAPASILRSNFFKASVDILSVFIAQLVAASSKLFTFFYAPVISFSISAGLLFLIFFSLFLSVLPCVSHIWLGCIALPFVSDYIVMNAFLLSSACVILYPESCQCFFTFGSSMSSLTLKPLCTAA